MTVAAMFNHMHASHLRWRIMAHLIMAARLEFAGNARLALAARQMAAMLRVRLCLLRIAAP